MSKIFCFTITINHISLNLPTLQNSINANIDTIILHRGGISNRRKFAQPSSGSIDTVDHKTKESEGTSKPTNEITVRKDFPETWMFNSLKEIGLVFNPF